MDIPNTTSSVSALFSRRLKFRHVLLVLAIAFAVFAYYTIVNSYYPNQNFIANVFRHFTSESYTFWSGSPGGFYIEIGKNLEDRSKRDSSINIVNREGSGGQQNLDTVSSSQNSMGLTQWDTLNSRTNARKKELVTAVGPLYPERLHILYNVDEWENCSKKFGLKESRLRLTIFKGKETPEAKAAHHFFGRSTVAVGPQQSGTRKFAEAVLLRAGLNPHKTLQIGFEKGFEDLTTIISEKEKAEKQKVPASDEALRDSASQRSVSVVFTIAGAPLPEVKKYLEGRRLIAKGGAPRIALASIDSELLLKLQEHSPNLSRAGFKGFYPDCDDAISFSSDAYLIASKDVPNHAIIKTLELIVQARADIRSQLGIGAGQPFQLSDTSFYYQFEKENAKVFLESFQEFVIFITTVVVGTIFTLTFTVWISSSVKKNRYLRQIERTRKASLPDNTNLDEGSGAFPRPYIFQNQSNIIGSIINGIKSLIMIATEIDADHAGGIITDSHFRHLSLRFSESKGLLERNLGRRLREYLEQGNSLHIETLRSYHTAGYLTTADYERLAELLDSGRDESSSTRESEIPKTLDESSSRTESDAPNITDIE